jgi:pantoate--beta-alanine ligase
LQIATTLEELNACLLPYRKLQKKIGFVPTMGALHSGHQSLMKQALKEQDIVVCSIFVNPTQFNDPADFSRYPITPNEDLELLLASGVHVLFKPKVHDVYPNGLSSAHKIELGIAAQIMEATHRPGHFDGVVVVVKRLFEMVNPDAAYFGEKDFQQLFIIRLLAKHDFPNLKIVPVPTMRESDGLAMSSRNMLIDPEKRMLASFIYKQMMWAKQMVPSLSVATIEKLIAKNFELYYYFELEYVEIRSEINFSKSEFVTPEQKPRIFVAAKFSGVRLIDNLPLF